MILIGIGLYLAYVPYNSLLFDRLIYASQRFDRHLSLIPSVDHEAVLGLGHDRHSPPPGIRLSHHRLQQGLQLPEKPPDAVFLKQIGVVGQRQFTSLRPVQHHKDQIELSGSNLKR